MNAFTIEIILNASTETAMPMIVYESVFAASWVFRGSPREVRYKKPAYKPIATEATAISQANQFTRLISVFVTDSAVIVILHDIGANAPVAPNISAISATMPGAIRNRSTPMTVYNTIRRANVAFCGSCPDNIKKNPASSVINTAMGGRMSLLIKPMTLHKKPENVVVDVGAANVMVVVDPTITGPTEEHFASTQKGVSEGQEAGHVLGNTELSHAHVCANAGSGTTKRSASAITTTKHIAPSVFVHS